MSFISRKIFLLFLSLSLLFCTCSLIFLHFFVSIFYFHFFSFDSDLILFHYSIFPQFWFSLSILSYYIVFLIYRELSFSVLFQKCFPHAVPPKNQTHYTHLSPLSPLPSRESLHPFQKKLFPNPKIKT